MSGNAAGQDRVRLTLAFSTAADRDAVRVLFMPPVKAAIDPQNFVIQRDNEVLERALDNGGALFKDERGQVQAMTLAYRSAAGTTEIGSTLSRQRGLAQLAVAAMALKEFMNGPQDNVIAANISYANGAGRRLYEKNLQWEEIDDSGESRRLSAAAGKAGVAGKSWFRLTDGAVAAQARILLSFIDQEKQLRDARGREIELDLSALENAGLGRAQLAAMANPAPATASAPGLYVLLPQAV